MAPKNVFYQFLPAGCHGNLPVLNLFSASVAKNQHFAPAGKTLRWIEKWLTPFRIVTTSCIIVQSLGEIELRAPAVGAKIWCVCVFCRASWDFGSPLVYIVTITAALSFCGRTVYIDDDFSAITPGHVASNSIHWVDVSIVGDVVQLPAWISQGISRIVESGTRSWSLSGSSSDNCRSSLRQLPPVRLLTLWHCIWLRIKLSNGFVHYSPGMISVVSK